MEIDKGKFFEKLGYKIIPQCSNELRNKSLALIKNDFPEIEDDIVTFADKNNINVGDLSIMVVIDIILPELKEWRISKDGISI